MAVRPREVKNKKNPGGGKTGRPGTVYDVNLKYTEDGKRNTYTKSGFLTEEEAIAHEGEMRTKLANPDYVHRTAQQARQPLATYLATWLEQSIRPYRREQTYQCYRSCINAHIVPTLGEIPLNQVTADMLDDCYQQLLEQGYADATVQSVRTTMGAAFEWGKRVDILSKNVARNSKIALVRNKSDRCTMNCTTLGDLISEADETLRMILVLGGLYGLRINEILGLRWRNVDLYEGTIRVVEQLPRSIPAKQTIVPTMHPVKSGVRTLPITEQTYPLLRDHADTRQLRRSMHLYHEDIIFYDNDLVLCSSDGRPLQYKKVLKEYYAFYDRRYSVTSRPHDLRRSAATNIHVLTGDFFTISQILGHSISSTADMLNLGTDVQCVTDQYISSGVDRKLEVLTRYHQEVFGYISQLN